MDNKELDIIIKEGEGYKTEFKENLGGLDKELVAFANASGGRIFLGVTDNGKIKGIEVNNKLKSRMQDIANNCKPKIKIFMEEFNNILIIKVREGDDKPHECASGFYKRISPNSQKMTRDEIVDVFKSEGKVRFDELIEPKFFYPRDFDKSKLIRFLQLAGLSTSIKTEKILLNLGIGEKQEGRYISIMQEFCFFAKSPQRLLPWSVFTVALFKDKGGANVIDRKEITGGLFEIVGQVIDFVRLYAKVGYRFTGQPQREEIYEYPFKAIREAVINSVMHKDYFEHGHNNILKFFPDRIQIENIWLKPRNFVLGKTIFRRNQLIADLFARIHFGEKLGSGMQRMRDICKSENAPYPRIEFTDTHFYIILKQSREYLKIVEKDKKFEIEKTRLNERQRKAIEYIKEKGSISISEYISLNNVSDKTTRRDLNDLVAKGIFKKEGVTTGLKFKLTSVSFGQLRLEAEEE